MSKSSIFIFLLLFPVVLIAQRQEKSWEIPFFIGGSNYIGDLAPDLLPSETKMVIGAGVKRNFNNYIGLGLHFNYGSVSASDKNFDYLAPRNLDFKSTITEIALEAEFNFFRFGSGYRSSKFSPYLSTGLGLFYFNPITEFEGNVYHLKNMHTEGQTIIDGAPHPYSLYNFAVLLGGGVKYKLNETWILSVNGAYRSTFTDYLDDVGGVYPDKNQLPTIAAALSDRSGDNNIGIKGSQRGNPDTNDWYIFAGFTLSYLIKASPCYTF